MVENLWVEMEKLAIDYVGEENEAKRQAIISEVLRISDAYIQTRVNTAVSKAKAYGVFIPREDFLSHFTEALWKAVESYDKDSETKFKNIVLHRLRLAEAATWRMYRTKGDESDKDGYSYESARWDSLDRKAIGNEDGEEKTLAEVIAGEEKSAEDFAIENFEINEILNGFAKKNSRHAKVIRYLFLGYEGHELAIITGEADKYNAKVRKLVQRAKESFLKYMNKLAF